MTKNPIINALTAALYISAVVSILFVGESIDSLDTIVVPMAMLSLFSLSAAVMSFIFFYQPVTLYLEGEKKVAVKLVIQTIASFAVITAVLLASLFFQAFSR